MPVRRHIAAAFTLVEVMFAVITLGIGLILVAAMFPVAIQQTKLTSEESTAASVARAGMETLASVGVSPVNLGGAPVSLLPPTAPATATTYFRGLVYPLSQTHKINPQLAVTSGTITSSLTYNAVKGNLIAPSDPRLGWVPFYRRDGIFSSNLGVSSIAQVILIPVRARNASTFAQADVVASGSGSKIVVPLCTAPTATQFASNFEPRYVQVTITPSTAGTNPDTIQFVNSQGTNTDETPANSAGPPQAEGAFIIIADDQLGGANKGWMNGHVFRLGTETTTAGLWNLAPGYDYAGDAGYNGANAITTLANADAYMVGRGFDVPAAPTMYTGPAMDVAVYTGFIYAQ